jgi:lipoate---protein ligase
MTAVLRVMDTGVASGRWNTALSLAMLQGAQSGGPVVRFYAFSPCVLLGASQAMAEGADLAFCSREGIEIARRITGGGSVYMSPGMLAWDVVTRHTGVVETVCREIGGALAGALQDLDIGGVRCSVEGLALGGRKISGAATTSQAGLLLYQGTLLIEDEITAMAKALGLTVSALAPHVSSVVAETGQRPDPRRLKAQVAAHLARRLGLQVRATELSPQDKAIATREHAQEIGTDAFVRGDDLVVGRRASA